MAITNGYVTLDEVKLWLGIKHSNDDTMLERAIESTSRQVDGICDRRFYKDTNKTKLLHALNGQYIEIPDLVTLTTLETDYDGDRVFEVTWTSSQYDLMPYNADQTSWPFTSIRTTPLCPYSFPTMRGGVRITGDWGWPAIPTNVKQAVILQTTRVYKRKDAPYGIAGSGEMGMVQFLPKVDSEVRSLLEPFMPARVWSV